MLACQTSILREQYHPVTLDDIADWLEHKKPLPHRAVAVTFDDGFADNYHLAAPIMEKHDIRGAIYLVPVHGQFSLIGLNRLGGGRP